jgi:radical SAM family uncharacterized protein/radical SAM-linked protein
MSTDHIQDILPMVEMPSRYLGTEVNSVKKDLASVGLKIALAFPDMYEIGISHFGLQILYHILNQQENIAAERVYAPGLDMESHLRASHMPLFSLESHYPVNQFDIVGFSLLYELNYTNLLNILDISNIPFYAFQRTMDHPLIIGGGPCTCNPEPVADFFDAIVIGDGEQSILEMTNAWFDWKNGPSTDKQQLLKKWSEIEGVYIPSFFSVNDIPSNGDHLQETEPIYADYPKATRATVADLDHAPFPDKPIVPFGKPVHDRLRLEVARGCTRGCRFCQAGMIYRPVRERSMNQLVRLCDQSLAATGYDDISLLSLSTGDYGCIIPLMENLMIDCESKHIALSLPSLRAETLSPQLMRIIKKVRKTGFTIAVEAGSQRLREVINKNITEEDIIAAVTNAFDLGWQVIKLYFMVGLPTETTDDLNAIVDLVKRLRNIKKPNGKKGQINVSVATFIPKPNTPFQWAPQITLAESASRIKWLKDKLKLPGIRFKWQDPKVSILEGLLARGDRRLSKLLVTALKNGCKFDGWSDSFHFDLWKKALQESDVDIDFFTTRRRTFDEVLPWDHIDVKLSKDFLENEWEKALKGLATQDCRHGGCHQCGVCDFKKIEPIVFKPDDAATNQRDPELPVSDCLYKWLRVEFSKRDSARFFGHLELMNILLRAFHRAHIPIKYSEGYHPIPKLSFEDSLPLGIESLREYLILQIEKNYLEQEFVNNVNLHLPEGIRILKAYRIASKSAYHKDDSMTYTIQKAGEPFDENQLVEFKKASNVIYTKKSHKGKVKYINLAKVVKNILLVDANTIQIQCATNQGSTVRPGSILKYIFNFSEHTIKRTRITKIS